MCSVTTHTAQLTETMRKMDNRLKLDSEVRELKLGSTFTNPNPRTVFHTLKYDFKPASVDTSKPATLEVGTNKQVTVTVPHNGANNFGIEF